MDVDHLFQVCCGFTRWHGWNFFSLCPSLLLDARKSQCRAFSSASKINVGHSKLQSSKIHKFQKISLEIYFSLPWNQDTYIGYLAEIIISNLSAYGFFILNGTSLLLFVSLCIHHRAFSKMFKHKINNSEKCDAILLSDLIRFHISAKE